MGRKLDSWILIYMLWSGSGDKHTIWAITIQDTSWKKAEPPKFDASTAQLLDRSRILTKSSAGTGITIALFRKQSSEYKFSNTISTNTSPSTKQLGFGGKINDDDNVMVFPPKADDSSCAFVYSIHEHWKTRPECRTPFYFNAGTLVNTDVQPPPLKCVSYGALFPPFWLVCYYCHSDIMAAPIRG